MTLRADASAGRRRVGPAAVLFVHYGDDWIRGTEIVLLELIRRMDRDRFTPYVACNHETIARAVRALGVEAFIIDRPVVWIDGMATRIQPIRWLRAVRSLKELADRLQAELFFCNNGQPSMVAYYAGGRGRIPCLSRIDSFYIRRDIHLYRLTRVPTLIFSSDEIRKSIAGKARLDGRTHVVHNGTDVERFRPSSSAADDLDARIALGVPTDRVVIGQVGSQIRRKGVDLLIRACARLVKEGRPVHLALVGSGPEADTYRALARELDVGPDVTFAGDVGDPAIWYRNVFDINVLASREEAFGISLIEGAASGLPLVAARTGGMQEIVEDGVTGLFFRPDDVEDLLAGLRCLVDQPEVRARMGQAARSRVESSFSVQRQVGRIEDILAGMLDRT